MQKEDLIKRLRLFAAVTTTLFVIMVVALLVQFGFIANYHKEIHDLHNHNEEIQQEIKNLQQDIEYIENAFPEDQKARNAASGNKG